VFCFIGGYPLGMPMNYYAFDGLWEGVPFGTDATDNKTQLLFVYLLFASLATLGSFSRGRWGRDLFAPRTLGWIGLGSFGVMLFIYLIPHSIQFSARFTYAFCYTWIGVVAALYVLGVLRNRAVHA
jgi:ABC-type Fe3+-siderophore transport system permease subunit